MNINLIGNQNATRKLTPDDVRLIREAHRYKVAEVDRLNRELSAAGLAKQYGVHQRTIEKVLTYETWRHVE